MRGTSAKSDVLFNAAFGPEISFGPSRWHIGLCDLLAFDSALRQAFDERL